MGDSTKGGGRRGFERYGLFSTVRKDGPKEKPPETERLPTPWVIFVIEASQAPG
jgi:hypothetical protein